MYGLDHRWPQEYQQVGLGAAVAGGAEEEAQARNVAEQRHLAPGLGHIVLDQAAKDDDLLVLGQNGGGDLPLGGDHVREARVADGRFDDVGDLLVHFHAHRGAVMDVGGDLQRQADVLALHGGEGVGGAVAGGGEAAGTKRHLLAHDDGRLLVVQGHDAGRRQQVGVAGGGQRSDDATERDAIRVDPRCRQGRA